MGKAPDHMLSAQSIVVAIEQHVCSDLAGQAVILDLESGVYYGLDDVGSVVWHLMKQPRSVSEMRDILLEQYLVDRDRCERDLLALLDELATNGLIRIRERAVA
jgi:hypothetical protein